MNGAATLYLVRHAVAEDRGVWSGPDALRPLTPVGWRQAVALAEQLGRSGVKACLSSPTVRCQDTLFPGAHSLGLAVEDDPLLFEDEEPRGREAALQLLQRLLAHPAGTVAACTHGNVLLPLLAALDDGSASRCPKGGLWRVDSDPQGRPRGPAVFLGRLDPQSLAWKGP